ncbi:MAG: hypothetical protein QXU40_00200 [Candidatus Pacearchaeota archaeon]
MVNFILIGLILLLLIFLSFKINNLRTRVAFFFIFLGIAFLFLTVYIAFSGKEINLKTVEGVSSAIRTYASWLSAAGSNLIKIGGFALKQDWSGGNKSAEKKLEESD